MEILEVRESERRERVQQKEPAVEQRAGRLSRRVKDKR